MGIPSLGAPALANNEETDLPGLGTANVAGVGKLIHKKFHLIRSSIRGVTRNFLQLPLTKEQMTVTTVMTADDLESDEEEEDLGPPSTVEVTMEVGDDSDACPPERVVTLSVGTLMPSPKSVTAALYLPQATQTPAPLLPPQQAPALVKQPQPVPLLQPFQAPVPVQQSQQVQQSEPMDLSSTTALSVQVPPVQPMVQPTMGTSWLCNEGS